MKNVVEHTYLFRLFRPDGTPTGMTAVGVAESEEAARLHLPDPGEQGSVWKLIRKTD